MACGQLRRVYESYWGFCNFEFNYPCLGWCRQTIMLPCGIKWCGFWPCGFKWCPIRISLPCIKTCKGSLPYPCKKYREVEKYCYDFSSVSQDCKVFFETLYGCCNGREYKWTAACFGWVSSYLSGRTVCFNSPLEDLGPCRDGYSIPPGGTIPTVTTPPGGTTPLVTTPPGGTTPAEPTDGGSVSIHGGSLNDSLTSKLGTCQSCIRFSSIGLLVFVALSILVGFFIPSSIWWIKAVCYLFACFFLVLRLAHFLALRARKKEKGSNLPLD